MSVKGSKNMELYGDNKTIRSQLKASESYDKNNVDSIRLRVPKGWRDQIQAYVNESDKYRSVNAMICDLIRQEVNIKE